MLSPALTLAGPDTAVVIRSAPDTAIWLPTALLLLSLFSCTWPFLSAIAQR